MITTLSLWWIVLLISSWGGLFLFSDRKRFRLFASGGLWSILIALLLEALVRRHIGYFKPDELLVPVYGTELLLLIGPRFAEGVFFMQRMAPSLQPLRILLWAGGALLAENGPTPTAFITLTTEGVAISWLVHALRFAVLLGLYYAFDYIGKKTMIEQEAQAQAQRQLVLQASRHVWMFSWPFFWLSAGAFAGLLRRFTRDRT